MSHHHSTYSHEAISYSGHGTIQLDYAFIDRPAVLSTRIFHTRQLFCEVFMTVHRAIVPHSLDILRLGSLPGGQLQRNTHRRTESVDSVGRRAAALDKRLEDSLRTAEGGQHCLVSVDVRNGYGLPFEVALGRCGEGPSLARFSSQPLLEMVCLRALISVSADDEKLMVWERLEPGATARSVAQSSHTPFFKTTGTHPLFYLPSAGCSSGLTASSCPPSC